MGCGNSEQKQSTWNDQTTTTTLKDATPEELALRQQMEGLGTSQNQGVLDAINRPGPAIYWPCPPPISNSSMRRFNRRGTGSRYKAKTMRIFCPGVGACA